MVGNIIIRQGFPNWFNANRFLKIDWQDYVIRKMLRYKKNKSQRLLLLKKYKISIKTTKLTENRQYTELII